MGTGRGALAYAIVVPSLNGTIKLTDPSPGARRNSHRRHGMRTPPLMMRTSGARNPVVGLLEGTDDAVHGWSSCWVLPGEATCDSTATIVATPCGVGMAEDASVPRRKALALPGACWKT